MRIYEHITSQNVKNKIFLSKIYPLENYFYYYFKNKKLDKFIRSLNGIFTTDKENILSIKKELFYFYN